MSRKDEPFVEVYWRLEDEYPEVWDDDHALAWYVRLMKLAEGMWPSAATVPAGIPAKVWAMLTRDEGLVLPDAGGRRYRIRGLDAKRNARRNAASTAARSRWGTAEAMPHSTAQHSTPQHSSKRMPNGASDDTWTVALLLEEMTGRTPSPKVMGELKIDVEQLGPQAVMSEVRRLHETEPGPWDASTLYYAAHNALFPLRGQTRQTPAERRQQELADAAARMKADARGARA